MTNTRSSLLAYLLAGCIGLLGLTALWYGLGRPMQLADAASPVHKLQCASYTPFDKHQSPFDQPLRVSEARMDADLALLGKTFACLRTYSVSGLEALPALARKHGLKLIIGAWVSRDAQATAVEIAGLIEAANRYPDVIEAVIVGNEALPEFLVKVEADRIAQGFDGRHQAAGGNAAGQGVGDRERDGEMHQGKGQGLEHGAPRVRIIRCCVQVSQPCSID